MCAAQKKALALYHERTLAIMTGEPRVCTLACTPGATKALADAHARRTRRDLNISTVISEQFRRRRSGVLNLEVSLPELYEIKNQFEAKSSKKNCIIF